MRILLIRDKANPVLRDVLHDLYIFQQIVGGRIEVAEPFDDNVVLVCDESGRNKGKPVNRVINDHMAVCGDFFLCGHDGEGLSDFPLKMQENHTSLFALPASTFLDNSKYTAKAVQKSSLNGDGTVKINS